jgi:hypothetical protein
MTVISKVPGDALDEAYDAACRLLPLILRHKFVLVGGAALHAWGLLD